MRFDSANSQLAVMITLWLHNAGAPNCQTENAVSNFTKAFRWALPGWSRCPNVDVYVPPFEPHNEWPVYSVISKFLGQMVIYHNGYIIHRYEVQINTREGRQRVNYAMRFDAWNCKIGTLTGAIANAQHRIYKVGVTLPKTGYRSGTG